jgi:hypothetical protein
MLNRILILLATFTTIGALRADLLSYSITPIHSAVQATPVDLLKDSSFEFPIRCPFHSTSAMVFSGLPVGRLE